MACVIWATRGIAPEGCRYMERAKQTSESIELGIVLALAGGFMDAYSYVARDGVFANAQTGRRKIFLTVNLIPRRKKSSNTWLPKWIILTRHLQAFIKTH